MTPDPAILKSIIHKMISEGDVAINPGGYLVMPEEDADPRSLPGVVVYLTPEEFSAVMKVMGHA